jgi:hypothetical protein
MRTAFFNFYKKSTLISILLFVLGLVTFSFLIPAFYLPVFPFLLLFFYFLSLILQFWLYRIAKMNISKFTARFLAITMLKMFLLLIFALVYILQNKEEAIAFIVVFFLLYVIFTALEVRDIMKITSKK